MLVCESTYIDNTCLQPDDVRIKHRKHATYSSRVGLVETPTITRRGRSPSPHVSCSLLTSERISRKHCSIFSFISHSEQGSLRFLHVGLTFVNKSSLSRNQSTSNNNNPCNSLQTDNSLNRCSQQVVFQCNSCSRLLRHHLLRLHHLQASSTCHKTTQLPPAQYSMVNFPIYTIRF